MQREQLRPYFLLIVLLGAVVITAFIFAPFLKPLALAAIFAVVLQGLYDSVARAVGARPGIAAFVTILISTIVFLLPVVLVGSLVANEARAVYGSLESESVQNIVASTILRSTENVGGLVPAEFARALSTDVDTYTKSALQWLVAHGASIVSGISSTLLSLGIFFIALYYLLRDGKRMRQTLIKLSPLDDCDDEGVFLRLERSINSIIKGNLVIALIQGVLTAIGFSLFGVAHAVLWGTAAAMAALVPGVGTSLIFIPAVAYLFFIGTTIPAAGLLVWGLLAVGLIDNLLGPRLIGRGMQIHPLLVLLSVLGGLFLFGPAGVFLGPLSLAFLFAVLSIYVADSPRGV